MAYNVTNLDMYAAARYSGLVLSDNPHNRYMVNVTLKEAAIGWEFWEYQAWCAHHWRWPKDYIPLVSESGMIVDLIPIDQFTMPYAWSLWKPLDLWLMPTDWQDVEAVAFRRYGVGDWIKLSEAARRLSCHPRTLHRWREAGHIAKCDMLSLPGNHWVVLESALEELLRARSMVPAAR